jgi:hypothetical protein
MAVIIAAHPATKLRAYLDYCKFPSISTSADSTLESVNYRAD